ncbi:hypothetical protein L21SP2_3310 [Salinispira pacifica]|uniref:Uncharacterized protein n=2 Tax=Salinispira pacifica TaxID=1307761 RepID=V5WM11_9SPIO|nr:hypothetical protein L21SP2_3310 [Salinispira pacifica]
MFAIPALYLMGFEIAEKVLAGIIVGATEIAEYAVHNTNPGYWLFILIALGLQFFYQEGTRIQPQEQKVLKGSHRIGFQEIAGLQVLTKQVFSRRSGGFMSYELNLVQNNGNRLTLMNHGDQVRLLHDARKIADVIERPLWAPEFR